MDTDADLKAGNLTADQHSWTKQSMQDYADDNTEEGADDSGVTNDMTDNEMYDAFLEQHDMADVDLEDILEAEEGLPVDNEDSPASGHDSYIEARMKLGLYFPPPLRIRTPEEMARERAAEERKKAIREEEAMMVAAGYRYVRAGETRGEALLGRHPYLAQYQVRQRSLLRNAWVWRDDEENGTNDEWESFSVHMSWAAGNGSRKS